MRAAVARHDELIRGRPLRSTVGRFSRRWGTAWRSRLPRRDRCLGGGERPAAAGGQGLAHADADPGAYGLHTGEAERRDGDYFGTAVNRAARVMAVGHGGGEVLCSRATAAVVEGEVALVDLGEHGLRDLDRSQRVFRSRRGAFPQLASMGAFPGNLPLEVSSFIGRERELARVVRALAEYGW